MTQPELNAVADTKQDDLASSLRGLPISGSQRADIAYAARELVIAQIAAMTPGILRAAGVVVKP